MGQCIRERLSWGLQISRKGFSRGLGGTKAQEPGGRRQLSVVHMGQPVHRSENGPVTGKPGGVGISSKSTGEGVLCSSLCPEGGRTGLSSPQRFTRSSGSYEVHTLRWEAEKGLHRLLSSEAEMQPESVCKWKPLLGSMAPAVHEPHPEITALSKSMQREIPTYACFSKYLLTQNYFLAAQTTKTAFLNEQKVAKDQCLK